MRPFLALGARRHSLVPRAGEAVPFVIENVPYGDRFGRETVSFVRTFAFPHRRGPVRRHRFDAQMVLAPGGDAEVHESFDERTGRFRVRVAVVNRRLGPLFGYEGSFAATYGKVGARGVRPGLRPVREESRR